MLTRNQRILKRLIDISISIVLLVFVIIPLVLLLILAALDLKKNGLFVQERIGHLGKLFAFLKYVR